MTLSSTGLSLAVLAAAASCCLGWSAMMMKFWRGVSSCKVVRQASEVGRKKSERGEESYTCCKYCLFCLLC